MFAALGDETRLAVLAKLCNGLPQSISRLAAGTNLSRQAVTKHLRVLANVGVVRNTRGGKWVGNPEIPLVLRQLST